jgi:hypothetical protein
MPSKHATMPKKQLYWLICTLLSLSILGIASRLYFLGSETLAKGDQLWSLTINASINTVPQDTLLKIFPPFDTHNIRTIQSKVSYPGFKIRKSSDDEKYQRSIHVIAADKGKQTIFADYLLHLSQAGFPFPENNLELSTEKRESFLPDNTSLQFKSHTVREVVNKLLTKQLNQDSLVNEIYTYVRSLPLYLGEDTTNVPQILTQHKATKFDRTLVMISLSRAGGIPARLVSGIILKDDLKPVPHYWVEIYQGNRWDSYDVYYGYKKTVPINYLPLRRNSKNIIEIKNGEILKLDYDLEQEFNHPYLQQKQKGHFSSVFNLSRLPLNVRNELALLLLLPLGALITSLFRHLAGVHSYGVFTPTLLALALVYANFMTTVVIFFIVTSLAIAGRSIFPATLTRIPRLSIIFTLIAVILTMSVSILNYFDIDQGGKIILLPIIILTSLVDRFYRAIEDKGVKIALSRMAWTILIAILCLPIVQFSTLGHLILQYPEIHFTTLALFVIISMYKGKSLLNLPIFKMLAEPETTTKKTHAS